VVNGRLDVGELGDDDGEKEEELVLKNNLRRALTPCIHGTNTQQFS
jgi:hypothetical protein